jgi:spore coat protein CotF
MNRQKQFSNTSRNRLSDRDMLLDLLMTEKHLSSLYEHGVMEASSPMVSNTLESLQADAHDTARNLFTAMQERGWYNTGQGERSGRSQKSQLQRQTTANFNQTADSRYAVTSGARNFGRRLPQGQSRGKSGIYNTQTEGMHYHDLTV